VYYKYGGIGGAVGMKYSFLFNLNDILSLNGS
jgi:hypothetical protein